MGKKTMHENFVAYTNKIYNHPNYKGLPISKKKNGELTWVTTKQSKIGKGRIQWAKQKAIENNIDVEKPYYSKIMLQIHPSKIKTCQICGEEMSLYYIYPNANFIKFLIREFDYEPNTFDTIYDITEHLREMGNSDESIKEIYVKQLKLNKALLTMDINELIKEIELICRSGKKNAFGPGAMSNFPDRFDGFHSYNRCCRSTEDKGRSKENLRSYGKDRRAYEYWSDGNIHAANKYMNSERFKNTSADHIGPISLGFIHDPRFLQPMFSGENSAKRDRLDFEDLEKLIELENELNITPVSWFATKIWEIIKSQYSNSHLNIENARLCLKTNITNFMEVLWEILEYTDKYGELFLEEKLLKDKKRYFENDYEFDNNGNIIKFYPRNITDSTRKEYSRFIRVSFNSAFDFHEKENRNIKVNFNEDERILLDELIKAIKKGPKYFDSSFELLKELVNCIQANLIINYLEDR